MSKENFKQLIKLLIRPFVFICLLTVIGLLVVALVRGVIICREVIIVKSALKNTEYQIKRLETMNSDLVFHDSTYLRLYNNSFVIFNESFKIQGNYKLVDEGTILFFNCDSLCETLCHKYSISITKRGLNLINNKTLITTIRINDKKQRK